MKRVYITNWIIAGFYFIGGILAYIFTVLNPTDKAGQGMALAFSIIIIVFGVIIAGINLIKVKWVRIFCLILGLLSLLYNLTNMM